MDRKQGIKVIILVGRPDFGRCKLASQLLTAMWPVAGKSVLERLLAHIADQGIKHVAVCSEGSDSPLVESINSDERLEVEFINEQLPVGPAGCIRAAVGSGINSLLLVISASMVSPPLVDDLLNAHSEGHSDLTMLFNPGDGLNGSLGDPAGIYVCEPSVLENIPEQGYFDIKEGLIPEMLRVGKSIYAAVLPNHVGNFREHEGYLRAITNYLGNPPNIDETLSLYEQARSGVVWVSNKASVDQNAQIFGPTVILDGANISRGALIFGPTMVEKNVNIGEGSVVIGSVLWEGSQVGARSEVRRCVLDYNAAVQSNIIVEERPILSKSKRMLSRISARVSMPTESSVNKVGGVFQSGLHKIKGMLPNWLNFEKPRFLYVLLVGLIIIAFLWSYWPTIIDLWQIWQKNDEYSSGLLVPFLAVYILWSRRHNIYESRIKPSIWGLFAFIAAQAFRLFGLFLWYNSAERLSIVLSIAALVILLFGWQVFQKVFTVLLFSFLMMPWPNRVQAFVTLPLQRWATSSAVFSLEMLGYDVIKEGNIIHIGDSSVAVAEACNGLRMVTAFFVISGLVVLLIKRSWWEKLIVLASSLPIALFCNTTRLTITAIAFTVLSGEYWERMFHDFGGYAMMPLALGAIIAELWLLTKLTTLPTKDEAIIITRKNK
jgi:exosortase